MAHDYRVRVSVYITAESEDDATEKVIDRVAPEEYDDYEIEVDSVEEEQKQ